MILQHGWGRVGRGKGEVGGRTDRGSSDTRMQTKWKKDILTRVVRRLDAGGKAARLCCSCCSCLMTSESLRCFSSTVSDVPISARMFIMTSSSSLQRLLQSLSSWFESMTPSQGRLDIGWSEKKGRVSLTIMSGPTLSVACVTICEGEWAGERTRKWAGESVDDWTGKLAGEWAGEWANERAGEWTRCVLSTLACSFTGVFLRLDDIVTLQTHKRTTLHSLLHRLEFCVGYVWVSYARVSLLILSTNNTIHIVDTCWNKFTVVG